MKSKRYKISNIHLKVGDSWDKIPQLIEKKCGFLPGSIEKYKVVKESIDARKKTNILKVYTVEFETKTNITKRNQNFIEEVIPSASSPLIVGDLPLINRPIVVGFGPCGIFAALALAEAGYKPIIIERGASMDQRVKDVNDFWGKGHLNPESNVLFGEGGAGTFSDGKLTTGIKDPKIKYIFKAFVESGAPQDILYKQKPHIGTDVLREVVVDLRNKIESLGGEVWFNTCMVDIKITNQSLESIVVKKNNQSLSIKTNSLILAMGHSPRDSFELLVKVGIDVVQKPLSIGIRIEHPQELIDQSQYGAEDRLPPADYKLVHRCTNGRGVYSFCMCPGGEIITTTTQEGSISVNGMSYRSRNSGKANAGILCDVQTSDFQSDEPLAGVDFQKRYESLAFKNGGGNFSPPQCTYKEFKESSPEGMKVRNSLPDFAVESLLEALPVFGKKIKGFDSHSAIIVGVETRSSSPIRINRGKDCQSNIIGIFPAGEGAGFAGGITSAACDGIRVAESLIAIYQKPQ